MDSVLPHEVTHTIFATHFGGPLPRWADEGACTTVEHTSERKKQEDWLIRFIHERRGIPFNRMFAMTEYPRDILPLYAQGYSVTRYLIAQGGKQKFIAFVGDGIATNNWNAAVQKHYGYDRLGDLQLAWQAWLGRGQSIADVRRPGESNVVLASATMPAETVSPISLAQGTRPVIEQVAATGSDGWYARQVNTVAAPVRSDRIDRADRSAADKRVDRGRQSATVTPPSPETPRTACGISSRRFGMDFIVDSFETRCFPVSLELPIQPEVPHDCKVRSSDASRRALAGLLRLPNGNWIAD